MKHDVIEINSIDHIIGACFHKFPKFYNHFAGKSNLSGLDLGCRVPRNLMNLYHLFDFTRLIGLDSRNEAGCITDEYDHQQKYGAEIYISGSTFYDVYNQVYKSEDNEKPKIESKEEFDNIFLKEFIVRDAAEFMEDNEEKFGLIVASNILHFFPISKINWFLGKIKASLRENSIVCIKIKRGHEISDGEAFKALIRQHFNEGHMTEVISNGKWDTIKFINFEYE